MTFAEAVGSSGVALLLVAFVLTTTGKMSCHSRIYHAMNAVGATLSCFASAMIGFLPFVLLEASWALVAFIAVARLLSDGVTSERAVPAVGHATHPG